MPSPAAREQTLAAEGSAESHYYSWLEDYLERLEGKEAYREFQDRYLGTEQASDHWHGEDYIKMLRATQHLVESLTGDGVPFDRKRYQPAIVRARDAQDWDAYLYALMTYAEAARVAYIDYWGLRPSASGGWRKDHIGLAWALSEVMRLRGSEGMKELVKELHAAGYDDITLEDLMGEVYEQRSSAGGVVGGAERREGAARTFDAG